MPRAGLEPAHLSAPDPKSGVSANSTTWAVDEFKGKRFRPVKQIKSGADSLSGAGGRGAGTEIQETGDPDSFPGLVLGCAEGSG